MEAVVSEVMDTRSRRTVPRWLVAVARGFWAVVKYGLGVVLTMSPLGAVLVVGWTARVMRRTAVKAWWKRAARPYKKLMSFREAAAHRAGWNEYEAWPTWVVGVAVAQDLRRGRIHRLWAGVWENVRLGVPLLINTYLVLGLPCVLMATWWYAGWQVSFNKAYEYFSLGATMSLVGIVLYAVAMLYVPLAQARQAVAGEWRAFWDFRLIRRMMRRRWYGCLGLALGYMVAGLGVMVVLALPMAADFQDWFLSLPPERVDPMIRGYFLLGAMFIFPAYVALRWAAARVYASAIAGMLATGELRWDELSAVERQVLPEEGWGDPEAPGWTRRAAVRSWVLSAPFRLVGGAVAFGACLALVMQIYISQFFVYRGPRVWMSHPLVQLPWTDYTPSSRAEPR